MLAGLAGVLVLPWHSTITAPGLLRAERQVTLFTAAPGRLTQATANDAEVAAGQVLFTLDSPDTAYQRDDALAQVQGIKAQLIGQVFDPKGARDMPVAWSQLESAMAQLRSAEATEALLTTRAPFAGRLMDVPRGLTAGEWLPRHEPLGVLIDPNAAIVEAEVGEADVARMHPGDTAQFSPDDGQSPIDLRVRSVSPGALGALEAPELASIFGGGVAVRKEPDGRMVPQAAVYRVVLDLTGDTRHAAGELRRGTVHIEGDRVSPIARIWQRVVAVVMREAGP
jgi:putative peptide zinc metalloprotease protein